MKSIIVFATGCVAGLALGWYVGYIHPATTATRHAIQHLDRLEPEYIGPTLLAYRTIPLTLAGKTNAAVERLSDAIADYYRTYAVKAGTNEYRSRARAFIEAMARTNQILASRIEYKMTNEPLRGFERVWVDDWKEYIYVGWSSNSPANQSRSYPRED